MPEVNTRYEKAYNVLKHLQWNMVGSLLGYGIGLYLRYRRFQEFFDARSAPWYTELPLYGAPVAALIAVLGVVRLLLKRRMQKDAE